MSTSKPHLLPFTHTNVTPSTRSSVVRTASFTLEMNREPNHKSILLPSDDLLTYFLSKYMQIYNGEKKKKEMI